MPSSREIDVLRNKRAALLAQVEKLDRQIAALASASAPRSTAEPIVTSSNDPILRDPDALLAQLTAHQPPASLVSKLGCWIVFGVVMLIACGIVAVIGVIFYR